VRTLPSLLVGLALIAAACGTTVDTSGVITETELQGVYDVPAGLRPPDLVAEQMRYLVWLPHGYGEDADRRWPMIMFLHGSGDDDYDAAWVQTYGLPAVLFAEEQPPNFEFIVISPQAEPGSAWWTGNQLDILDALAEQMSSTYLVDRSRVYLTGLSMGGYGSWFLAMEHPERFAAMVSLSGSGWRQPVLPAGDVCRMADLPIRAIHGSQDKISEPEPNQSIVALYESVCETEVFFEMYPDAGHFETYARAYRDPELYEWLLQHTKS
jgi:predicted peptidase